jgi:hypothetical protein
MQLIANSSINMNSTSSASKPVELSTNKSIGVHIVSVSGTHVTHVVTLQLSPNNINWVDTTTTATGSDKYMSKNDCFGKYARVKVSTAEGAASVCDISIFCGV